MGSRAVSVAVQLKCGVGVEMSGPRGGGGGRREGGRRRMYCPVLYGLSAPGVQNETASTLS